MRLWTRCDGALAIVPSPTWPMRRLPVFLKFLFTQTTNSQLLLSLSLSLLQSIISLPRVVN